MRNSDIFVIAAWAATVFGLMEGIVLTISRAYPVILAPFKASAQLLWVSPLIDLVLFLLAAVGLFILLKLVGRWLRGLELQLIYGAFLFIGIFTVIESPKLIHILAVTALSLGLSVVITRRLSGLEVRLTDILRQRLYLIPVIIILLGVGVFAYEAGREMIQARSLPTTTMVIPVEDRAANEQA